MSRPFTDTIRRTGRLERAHDEHGQKEKNQLVRSKSPASVPNSILMTIVRSKADTGTLSAGSLRVSPGPGFIKVASRRASQNASRGREFRGRGGGIAGC